MADIRETGLGPEHNGETEASRLQREAAEVSDAKEGVIRDWSTKKEEGALKEAADNIIGTHHEAVIPLPDKIETDQLGPELTRLLRIEDEVERTNELRQANLSPDELMTGLAQTLKDHEKKNPDQRV